MTQAQLNQAVARATGESLAIIRRHGFSIIEMPVEHDFDDPPTPQVVDWDALDAERATILPHRRKPQRIAA